MNPKPSLKKIASIERRTITLDSRELVRVEPAADGASLPVTVTPVTSGLDLVAWAANNRDYVTPLLLKHGAVYFRGFNPMSVTDFERFIRAVSGTPLEYGEPTSPRSSVAGRIYTSTDYPASQSIFLHNENSYASTWPMKLFFFCVTPAEAGGETLIADSRKIFKRIDPRIRERFAEKKILYVRNYGDGLGLSWQAVFRTEDKAVVEEFCRESGYELTWKDGDRLTTRRVGQAVAQHPHTGEMVWFNHGAFFHITTLDPTLREVLLGSVSEDELPYNTYYGDGTPIEAEVLDEIREAYRRETVARPWEAQGVLMLDNMLTAHGRAPFVGERKVLVGMSEPFNGHS